MTFAIIIGKYGGFYVNFGKESGMYRICLGWIAIDLYKFEIDEVMKTAVYYKNLAEGRKKG